MDPVGDAERPRLGRPASAALGDRRPKRQYRESTDGLLRITGLNRQQLGEICAPLPSMQFFAFLAVARCIFRCDPAATEAKQAEASACKVADAPMVRLLEFMLEVYNKDFGDLLEIANSAHVQRIDAGDDRSITRLARLWWGELYSSLAALATTCCVGSYGAAAYGDSVRRALGLGPRTSEYPKDMDPSEQRRRQMDITQVAFYDCVCKSQTYSGDRIEGDHAVSLPHLLLRGLAYFEDRAMAKPLDSSLQGRETRTRETFWVQAHGPRLRRPRGPAPDAGGQLSRLNHWEPTNPVDDWHLGARVINFEAWFVAPHQDDDSFALSTSISLRNLYENIYNWSLLGLRDAFAAALSLGKCMGIGPSRDDPVWRGCHRWLGILRSAAKALVFTVDSRAREGTRLTGKQRKQYVDVAMRAINTGFSQWQKQGVANTEPLTLLLINLLSDGSLICAHKDNPAAAMKASIAAQKRKEATVTGRGAD